ncbi:hypothetical protein OAN47_03555 [Planctomycetota bacterium]|nr:hypothetical protein [Planctomycetota bacterium]
MLALLLVGCTTHKVETHEAVIHTKGWPLVAVHIEGPGGDRTTVPFEVITDKSYIVDPQLIAMVLSLVMTGIVCWVLKATYELGRK